MHFEILVEDASGKIALESLVEKILGARGEAHTWRILPYKGIGSLPEGLKPKTDPCKRILLDHLPRLLRGYGRSFQYVQDHAVVVVVDLDSKDCKTFKQELLGVLSRCNPAPRALFRIAIEEVEAWLLGDRHGVEAAYPRAKGAVLDGYVQDSVCGTWEVLAAAVHPGGASELLDLGYPHTGRAKCEWAETIAPHVDVERNRSRSFQVFRDGLRALAAYQP